MEALLKAGLFIGAVLLLGAGLFARWVGPELVNPSSRRRLRLGLLLGAGLVVAASLAEVALTVSQAIGSFSTEFFLDYLLYTRHGRVTLVRLGLAVLLLGLGLGAPLSRRLERFVYGLVGVGFLASLSAVSHSGVLGPLPFLGDLAHLVAATLWAGALLYFAWAPSWKEGKEALVLAVERVSKLGVSGVIALTLTGIYASTLHLFGLDALSTTSYGQALVAKVTLVVIILGIAGANRWLFMPRLKRQGESLNLRRAVRLESILLVGVLSVTGVLATREPAHEHPGHEMNETHLADAEGAVAVEPFLEPGAPPALILMPAREAALELMGPSGDFSPVLRQGAHGLTLDLPSLDPGIWRVSGEIDGEALDMPVTLLHAEGETRLVLTGLLVPTPTLSRAGESRIYVYLEQDGRMIEAPVLVSYRMPGMVHSGDDDLFELDYAHAHHSAGAPARQGLLRFPMAGRWEVTVMVPEEGERFVLEVEVLGE